MGVPEKRGVGRPPQGRGKNPNISGRILPALAKAWKSYVAKNHGNQTVQLEIALREYLERRSAPAV